jgi:hypothetical protein
MIHIFFVPGMFGSTIEYVLRCFTKEYTVLHNRSICSDGSMHNFIKEFHPKQQNTLVNLANLGVDAITTPIYPFCDMHLPEILQTMQLQHVDYHTDKFVLLHTNSVSGAELNILFQYHKIAAGQKIKLGLESFCGNNAHNIKNWNASYTNWKDMQTWELREWFSLFYVSWVQEWIQSQYEIDNKFLKIDHLDVLNDFVPTMEKIINHCGLTLTSGLEKFGIEWRHKQQYIVDEFDLLNQIISHTVSNKDLTWNPINVISEAIIQQRLRSLGYEIRCDQLNTFPTDSKTLYNLLEKV